MPDYCGCCGNQIPYGEWCKRCMEHIIKRGGIPPWERTYFAQHSKDCPFEATEEAHREPEQDLRMY